MNIAILILLGYLIGSVPFALVIGKGFYNTDVREHGSRNLGASNSGRVLGLTAGAAVMILDAAKAFLVVILAARFCDDPLAIPLGGLAAGIGHCYPIFAKFKGGKAVATLYGFLFGLFTFGSLNPPVFFLPLGVFIVTLLLTKIISLSSMLSSIVAAVYVYCTADNFTVFAVLLVFSLLIIVRHKENIKRILRHEENKITWI